MDSDIPVTIEPRRRSLDPELVRALEYEVGSCPDVAFAHLPDAYVPGHQEGPEPVLFVWLVPRALSSLRSALDLVAAAVARALPDGDYLDIVVLNSAPELLADVERAGCLLVERDPEERRRALTAAGTPAAAGEDRRRPRWWPLR